MFYVKKYLGVTLSLSKSAWSKFLTWDCLYLREAFVGLFVVLGYFKSG